MNNFIENQVLKELKNWASLSSERSSQSSEKSCVIANYCSEIIEENDKFSVSRILSKLETIEERNAFIQFIGMVADLFEYEDSTYTFIAIPIISSLKINTPILSFEKIMLIEKSIHDFNYGGEIKDLVIYPRIFSVNKLCQLNHSETNSLVLDSKSVTSQCSLEFSDTFNNGDNAIFILGTCKKDKRIDLRNIDKLKSAMFGSDISRILDIKTENIGYLTCRCNIQYFKRF
jgi:hypothetical protein